jgi:ABC-type transport system involved in cytochrome c biogenesis permease subunit
MNQHKLERYAPWIAAGVTLLYFGFFMLPMHAANGDFDYHQFGRLHVIDGGRHKPLDSVARANLMILTHRQAFYDRDDKKEYPATKWLLDVMTTPHPNDKILTKLLPQGAQDGRAWDDKIFRIENDQVLRLLDLKMRDGLRYSLREIGPHFRELDQEIHRIRGDPEQGIKGIDPKQMKLFDAKIMELSQHIDLFLKLSAHAAPLAIPNPDGTDQWHTFASSMQEFLPVLLQRGQIGDEVDARTFDTYLKLLMLYDRNKPKEFNEELSKHLAEVEKREPARMKMIDLEIFFNDFAPFYRCLEVYVIAALFGGLSWLSVRWSKAMRQAAYAAMGVAFVFHLSGLVIRMVLQDRMFVFVTNLYSSAVFIGLGCVLICLIVEGFFRNGIALVVGSVTGFCTLIIAHMLSLTQGDTMEMMQAVLDTNFWLATHVTCITLGYTTAFVAGFMGIAYILLGVFTDKLRGEGAANVARMTYGVLCTGMFLSFVGTVLGGLWADYSWGRFWGWDPKENGALLIVIWIALILHARWGGMVKQRGVAVLSVIGIVVTSWSWFGTNFLGVGLHSYGFRPGAMMTLGIVDLCFLAIAGIGLTPLQQWQSFRPPVKPEPPVTLPPISSTGIMAAPTH